MLVRSFPFAGEMGLGRRLPWLAAAGFLGAAARWSAALAWAWGSQRPALALAAGTLASASSLAMAIFGAEVYADLSPREALARAVRFIPAAVFIIWALGGLGALVGGSGLLAWVAQGDLAGRVLLYFPGASLAGLSLLARRGSARWERMARLSGLAFLADGFLALFVTGPGVSALRIPAGRLAPLTALTGLGVAAASFSTVVAFGREKGREVEETMARALAREEQARREAEALSQVLEERVRERTEALEALYEAAMDVAAVKRLETTLAEIAERVRVLARADGAVVLIQEEGRLVPRAGSGSVKEAMEAGYRPGLLAGEEAFRTGRLVTAEGEARPGVGCEEVAVPLEVGGEVLGSLCVGKLRPARFQDEEVFLVERMAPLASVALANARLLSLAEALSAAEERERIARELHDGLAQVLAFMSMKVQAAREWLSSGQSERAYLQLEEAARAAEEAGKELRQAILGLELAGTMGSRGLVETVRQYGQRLERMGTVELEVVEQDWPGLPPAAELHLFRIVQEAVSNAVRHGRARRVTVLFESEGSSALLEIKDEGEGFDPQGVKEGMGLRGMRERARAAGGALEVVSAPRAGCVVRVRVARAVGG